MRRGFGHRHRQGCRLESDSATKPLSVNCAMSSIKYATFTMPGAAQFLVWFDWIAFSKVTKKEVITHRALAHVEMEAPIQVGQV